ncbi:MAG: hypothetical protein KAS49_02130, partial [Candidatus Cloacimonetes bacterium]|nr:hypothetical protein [Candidatus Cloacimonadota bacterium]
MENKLFLCFFICFLVLTNLFGWELGRQTEFPAHFYDLEVAGDDVWVAGKDGAFARSLDNGETFQFVESPAFISETATYLDINAISAINENNIIAIGQDGLAMITTDAENWATIDSLATFYGTGDIEDVIYLDSGKIWVAGKSGKIAYSNDSGKTWAQQVSNTTNTIYAISMNESGTGYICGNNGSPDSAWVNKTIDFGETWSNCGASFAGNPHLNDVYQSDNRVVVCGAGGFLAVSDDNAQSFVQIEVELLVNDLKNIVMSGETGYVAGKNGELITTTDNWASAKLVVNNFIPHFDGIGFNANGELVACGWYGNIIKSSDLGVNW